MRGPCKERRSFLQGLSSSIALTAAGKLVPWAAASACSPIDHQSRTPTLHKESSAVPTVRWPKPIGSPVLDSLRPVIEHSRDVKTNIPKLVEVASWMGYEELPVPQYSIPFAPDSGNPS